MPHIQQLSPHVANLIAAGEVVERPASVVKELVENAIDAGCSAVAVEIQRGGMGLIRVSDNGCGIAPQELPTAFLRHATSKLRAAEDLGGIATLGFRGEALAAIAAVSRVEIVSRPTGAASGAAVRLEGGVSGEVEEAGAPEGTVITVRDLFYNTPARLKFMRKDSAETAAVAGLMQHLALSHPHISFRFSKDGAQALHTPGDGRLESAIYAALGRDFARSLLAVEGRGGETVVSGFVTQPLLCRGSRSMQVFFVNGRFIKSALLTAAVEEGYRNQLMKGKFPGCVLSVTLPVTLVDVNVHPAKTQIKFAREKEVFDAVYHTVLDCLDAKSFQKSADRPPAKPAAPAPPARPIWNSERKSAATVADSATPRPAYSAPAPAAKPVGAALGAAPASVAKAPFVPAIPARRQEAAEPPLQQTLAPTAEPAWRIAGEVLRTYIICESEEGCIWLIDKHAAHERVNFDRLKAAQTPPMRQTLLQPIAAELGREDAAALLESLPLLERFGFACEDFGDGTLLVREVPADVDAADAVGALEEFAAALRTGRSLEEKRERLLHTMACKAAIKGGWKSDPAELEVLVEKVRRGEVKYCPHGRPVAVRLSKYELAKMFGRA